MLTLFHPRFHDRNTNDKQGGVVSVSPFDVDSKAVDELFTPGIIKDAGDYVQYRKLFLKNEYGIPLTNVKVSLLNAGASLIDCDMEKNLDSDPRIDGDEVVKDAHTEPGVLWDYDWAKGTGYLDYFTSLSSSSTLSSSSSTVASLTSSSSSSSTALGTTSSTELQSSSSSSSTELGTTSSSTSLSSSSTEVSFTSSTSSSSSSTLTSDFSSTEGFTSITSSLSISSSSTEAMLSSPSSSLSSSELLTTSSTELQTSSSRTSRSSSSSTEVSFTSSSTSISSSSSSTELSVTSSSTSLSTSSSSSISSPSSTSSTSTELLLSSVSSSTEISSTSTEVSSTSTELSSTSTEVSSTSTVENTSSTEVSFTSSSSTEISSTSTEVSSTSSESSGGDPEAAHFGSFNANLTSSAPGAWVAGDIDQTFTAWVKFDSLSADQYIWGRWGATNNNIAHLWYNNSTGRLSFSVSTDGLDEITVDSGLSIQIDTWYLMTGWHDASGNVIGLQINDNHPDTVSHSGGVFLGASQIAVGDADDLLGVDGAVALPGFWKRVLTASERNQLWNGGDGLTFVNLSAAIGTSSLTAYYNLDEASFSNVWAAAHGSPNLGRANTVTSVTGPRAAEDTSFSSSSLEFSSFSDSSTSVEFSSFSSSSSTGPHSAAEFDGSNQYLSIADNASLSVGDIDITYSAWVYLDSKTVERGILSKWTFPTGDQELILRYDSFTDRFQFAVTSDGTTGTTASVFSDAHGSPSLDTWYLVTAWHDSVNDTINIRINDGVEDSVAHSGGIFDGTSVFFMGAVNNTPVDTLMDGRIAMVGFWKRLLSEIELNSLWNGGIGYLYEDLPANYLINLISYWNLDEHSGTRVDAHNTNDLADNGGVTFNFEPLAAEDTSYSSSSTLGSASSSISSQEFSSFSSSSEISFTSSSISSTSTEVSSTSTGSSNSSSSTKEFSSFTSSSSSSSSVSSYSTSSSSSSTSTEVSETSSSESTLLVSSSTIPSSSSGRSTSSSTSSNSSSSTAISVSSSSTSSSREFSSFTSSSTEVSETSSSLSTSSSEITKSTSSSSSEAQNSSSSSTIALLTSASSSSSESSSSKEFSSYSSSSSESSSSTLGLTTNSSSSSTELGFTVPDLPVGSSVGIWFRMTIPDTEAYDADDKFLLYVNPDETGTEGVVNQEYEIHHTRVVHKVEVFDGIYIRAQTNFVRVFFDHLVDVDWFEGFEGAIYSAYVNGKHVVDFTNNAHDIFVNKIDEIYRIEIFAIPHLGFVSQPTEFVTGRSAKMTFSVRRPEAFDINEIQIYTDNMTGTITDDVVTIINPFDGVGNGSLYLNSQRLVGAP